MVYQEEILDHLTHAQPILRIHFPLWLGLYSAAAPENDVLIALDKGVTIDQGGVQDENIRAAAHLVRGLSWGYLGLLFDKSVLVDEETKLEAELPFVEYEEMVAAAIPGIMEMKPNAKDPGKVTSVVTSSMYSAVSLPCFTPGIKAF